MANALQAPIQLHVTTMTPKHSRGSSEDHAHSPMSFILEHVLQYPGSYDVPLRTMHELNRKALLLPADMSRTQTPPPSAGPVSSLVSPKCAWTGSEAATMSFTSELMSQLKSLPTRPSSLPPAFIVSFVSRCFPPDLNQVDFHQALTALDYMSSLETRRRKETLNAFERLRINKDTYDKDINFMVEKFPGIALWVGNVEGKNTKAEQHYADIYLGLRRWIMINMLSEPFNKLNCLTMLNTLLPPMHDQSKLPSLYLDQGELKAERERFFGLIRDVQRSGPEILQPYMDLNKGTDDENGWPAVQRVVAKYLRVAENMIKDCMAITGPDSFTPYAVVDSNQEKKHDSGMSFGSSRRPSDGSSRHDLSETESVANFAPPPKAFSKLERITREFKRMRVKPRPEIEEITNISPRYAADNISQRSGIIGKHSLEKSLKKSRSLASLRFGNSSSASLVSRNDFQFDSHHMKKQRIVYDISIQED